MQTDEDQSNRSRGETSQLRPETWLAEASSTPPIIARGLRSTKQTATIFFLAHDSSRGIRTWATHFYTRRNVAGIVQHSLDAKRIYTIWINSIVSGTSLDKFYRTA
jgi:hypothetical protein